MSTTLFASFLSKIGPRAAQTKTNPRAAVNLWQRLFGVSTEEEPVGGEEQLQQQQQVSPDELDAPRTPAPIASPAARQQLHLFMQEMNRKQSTNRMVLFPPHSSSSPRSPLSPPAASPPGADDLRVPVRLGDSNMVHLAQ